MSKEKSEELDLKKELVEVEKEEKAALEGQETVKVTSVDKEERETGQKIEIPSAEELAARASSSFIGKRKQLNMLLPKMSKRGMVRVINAILDLPTDGVPNLLKGEEEKVAFALGQRVIQDRFIITQYHITQEVKRRKMEEEALKKHESKKTQGEKND